MSADKSYEIVEIAQPGDEDCSKNGLLHNKLLVSKRKAEEWIKTHCNEIQQASMHGAPWLRIEEMYSISRD